MASASKAGPMRWDGLCCVRDRRASELVAFSESVVSAEREEAVEKRVVAGLAGEKRSLGRFKSFRRWASISCGRTGSQLLLLSSWCSGWWCLRRRGYGRRQLAVGSWQLAERRVDASVAAAGKTRTLLKHARTRPMQLYGKAVRDAGCEWHRGGRVRLWRMIGASARTGRPSSSESCHVPTASLSARPSLPALSCRRECIVLADAQAERAVLP
jgi:hypothetical protein